MDCFWRCHLLAFEEERKRYFGIWCFFKAARCLNWLYRDFPSRERMTEHRNYLFNFCSSPIYSAPYILTYLPTHLLTCLPAILHTQHFTQHPSYSSICSFIYWASNGTLDEALNGAVGRTLDGALDGELDGTLDEALDGPLDGALDGTRDPTKIDTLLEQMKKIRQSNSVWKRGEQTLMTTHSVGFCILMGWWWWRK